MIEMKHDSLNFSFAKVHPSAVLSIDFQRTLRIPDDGKTHALPPGLGRFPLRHVDDFAAKVPARWIEHGGVMLPMYQAEAMWIHFSAGYDPEREVEYPFAVRIAAGKINAVTGQQWTSGLHEEPQDYVVVPSQPWLDGFCVSKGSIRQFIAMPLGKGYTAEEQITGEAEHGGVQVVVYPMKREVYERRFPKVDRRKRDLEMARGGAVMMECCEPCAAPGQMGLGAGGKMKQEIYDDPYDFSDWDTTQASRCFVHITNSQMWHAFTGEAPPMLPPTAKQYTQAGLPWFDYYGESAAVEGSPILNGIKSVFQMGKKKKESPLPENESIDGEKVVTLRAGLTKDQVREGRF